MVRKEIHFKVVEGNFDKYISLSDSIDEIIESHAQVSKTKRDYSTNECSTQEEWS